jgi:hypothetical protein
MIEADKGRQTPEIKQEGEIFKPFKSIPKFTELNLTGLESLDCQILYSSEFIFKNTLVTVDIFTEEYPESLIKAKTLTPLGKINKIISVDNNNTRVSELPVSLGIDLNFKSVKDYEDIQGHAIKFNLGKESYDLNLGGEDWPESMRYTIQNAKDEIAKKTSDYSLKDERGNTKSVLLPFDSDLLREITAQIVKKNLPRPR